MTKMYERRAAEQRQRVLDAANGHGIAMGGDSAYRAWLAAQNLPQAPATDRRAISQLGSVMRLQSLFGRQPEGSPLRNAIKVKRPD